MGKLQTRSATAPTTGAVTLWILGLGVLAAAGYYATLVHYLLFHSIAEIFSIVVAAGVFMFAWNARHRFETDFFVILGITYLFVAILDLLHTLSYTGMSIFPENRFYANQVWIATRAIEAGALLFAITLGRQGKSRGYLPHFFILGLISALVVVTVFVTETFPEAYRPGVGQTTFKIVAEYVVAIVLMVSLVLVARDRNRYPGRTRLMLIGALAATIAAEILFTFYVSNYGISNFFGHLFKVISFVLIYLAVIREGLQNPIALMHTRLAEREAKLRKEAKNRDLLLAVLAHDLRNPIGGIASVTDSTDWLEDPDAARETVSLLHQTAQSANRLLQNLLTLVRTQMGTIAVERVAFNLRELAEAVCWVNSASAKAKEIELVADVPWSIYLEADRTLVEMVVNNLVTNAIKFTEPGGRVTIEAVETGERARLSVVDTGIGMDEETLTALTEEGRLRSRPGTRGEKGTGIGFLLCKELVEANGGSIGVDSEPGRGTRVTTILPRAEEPGVEFIDGTEGSVVGRKVSSSQQ